MEPLLAIKLATEFVPEIIGLFSGDKQAAIEEAVHRVAKQITGKPAEESMGILMDNPTLALEFKKALLADKHVSEEMRLKDVANAREMYKTKNALSDYVAKSVIDRNLTYIIVLALTYVSVTIGLNYVFPLETALISGIVGTVGPLFGGIVNQLSKERSDVIGFLFGSSLGSKTKDKLIS